MKRCTTYVAARLITCARTRAHYPAGVDPRAGPAMPVTSEVQCAWRRATGRPGRRPRWEQAQRLEALGP